MKVIPETHRAP